MRITNALYKALEMQGNDEETIIELIEEMVESVLDQYDPEEVLYGYGLDSDYVLDLIEYCESM